MSAPQVLPLIAAARTHADRPAIRAGEGDFTYNDLLAASARVADALAGSSRAHTMGGAAADGSAWRDLGEERIAFMVAPGFAHVAVQWGIWRAGGMAVPLALSHPTAELAYVIDDAQAAVVIADAAHAALLQDLARARGCRFLNTADLLPELASRRATDAATGGDVGVEHDLRLDHDRGAMLLYTSGTTSKPKGVVITHGNLEAQTGALRRAWGWRDDDHILCMLPLHHVHGIVNVLTCALRSGARCTMLEKFDAEQTWRAIEEQDLTLFMAVPTIYARLIAAWESAPAERRDRLSERCGRMRLMVSGSAALPVSVLQRWRAISGHTLLERYGMTEIGMALSNPLEGERRPGFVGSPLPGVEVRLVDEAGRVVPGGTPGEIEVRGDSVFREYWRRPEATRDAFRDGWFRTGDVAVVESGAYRILGRSSTDIIKTGGYKVSALEIEEVLRTHEAVQECAVVGVPDEEWGERVCLAVVPRAGAPTDTEVLRAWAKDRLAPYKVPARVAFVADLPRNAMGKVIKPDVVKLFRAERSDVERRS